jgi:hypothetical protein
MTQILDLLLPHLDKLFSLALVSLMTFGVMLLRKLPELLRSFAEELAEKAKETETKADDALPPVLLALASALDKALERTFGPRKK